ncbi:MAG: type I-E CRISPR-associated protein Cse2/CasB [Rhodocyclales bacterium]|nr:type I-E CRISPR-associated protein Cse2/CasB [Rhodocyclales bacterium]
MTSSESRTPAAHVPALAALLVSAGISNGERAALKRMALDGPAPLALHRLLLAHVDDAWQDERWLADWRAVVCALAIQRDGGFNPAAPFGQALAEARFAESRLERLLAASGDTLRALALRAARQVAAKGIACDWRTFAELLFTRDSEYRERINTRIARDFYRTLQSANREE